MFEALESRVLLTGDSPGNAIVSSITVSINPVATSFNLSPASQTIIQYNTQQFTATALDQFGIPLASQPGFTWSRTGVGSISPTGLFSASGPGAATIIASTGTTSIQTTLTVVAPMLWLRNDAVTASPTLLDSAANSLNGTVVGTFGSSYNSIPGKINTALNLSSTSNSAGYVTLGTNFSTAFRTAPNFTVMAWINLTTLNNGARLFDFNTGSTTRSMSLAPAGANGLPRFAVTVTGGPGEKVVQGNTAITTGTWHFLAFTLNSDEGTLYLDGAPIGFSDGITINPVLLNATSKNYIGKSANDSDPNLNGSIDDFRIYGGAVSASAIAGMYSLGLSAANHMPGLVNPALAASSTIVGNKTTLTTLGTELAGESNLMYVWSATGSPPAPVAFSPNGTNGAKSTTATFTRVGTYNLLVTIADGLGYTATSSTNVSVNSAVVGRYIFYNNSGFDSVSDDNAIALNKSALFPGQTASFANYTSYSLGINGIMIDYAGPATSFIDSDFLFKVGNNSNPDSWITAPAPISILTRPGAGINGSTRIEIIWTDATIQEQWLQVTLNASGNSEMNADDIFYFGNAIGESGNSPADTKVDGADQLAPRFAAASSVPITNRFDYDRNGIVESQDENIARNCFSYFLNQLQLITPPAPPPTFAALGAALPLGTLSNVTKIPFSLVPPPPPSTLFVLLFQPIPLALAKPRRVPIVPHVQLAPLVPQLKFKPVIPH